MDGLRAGVLTTEGLNVYSVFNLKDTDFQGERVESERELNLEAVKRTRFGVESLDCGSWR